MQVQPQNTNKTIYEIKFYLYCLIKIMKLILPKIHFSDQPIKEFKSVLKFVLFIMYHLI